MENQSTAVAKKNILVVDDTPIVAETIDMLLSHLGHKVELSSDGQVALSKFESGKYNLVITDYAMPRMNGIQLAKAIKSQSTGQLILLISAFTSKIFAVDGEPLPVDLVMQKPFSMGEFQKALLQLFPAG
jgi:DNA-binding response OmpR family regulator